MRFLKVSWPTAVELFGGYQFDQRLIPLQSKGGPLATYLRQMAFELDEPIYVYQYPAGHEITVSQPTSPQERLTCRVWDVCNRSILNWREEWEQLRNAVAP